MGFLKKLSEAFLAPNPQKSRMRWYYIRCGKCGTKFKIGVNMFSEIVRNYDNVKSGESAYTLRKVAQDNQCFTPIEVSISYDHAQKEITQEIEGGDFISESEFKAD